MRRGTIELEDEVVEWLERLDDDSFGQAERDIDLLAEEGVHLGEPFTRQLRGKLRELRFSLDRRRVRITYYIASGRRIVLLTVFVKTHAKNAGRSIEPRRPCSAVSPRAIPSRRTNERTPELG